jgi:hypothetical protein
MDDFQNDGTRLERLSQPKTSLLDIIRRNVFVYFVDLASDLTLHQVERAPPPISPTNIPQQYLSLAGSDFHEKSYEKLRSRTEKQCQRLP